jgi:Ca2+-binding EF-hand superfamily protein
VRTIRLRDSAARMLQDRSCRNRTRRVEPGGFDGTWRTARGLLLLSSMRTRASLALLLALAAGCTSDPPAPAAGPAAPSAGGEATAPGEPGGRSAKIVPPMRRQAPPMLGGSGSGEPGAGPSEADREAWRQRREERRAERMAELDTNGDGTVSDDEREAMRARRQAEMIARIDQNGDGMVDNAEREAARQERVENMHAQLDADGDGKLTVAEAQAGRFQRFDAAAADTDHDGALSTEELAKVLPARGRRGPGGRGGGMWTRPGGGAGSGSAGPQ